MGKIKGFLFAVRHREILMTDLGLSKLNIAQTKNITLYLVPFYVVAIHFSALIYISYNLLKIDLT